MSKSELREGGTCTRGRKSAETEAGVHNTGLCSADNTNRYTFHACLWMNEHCRFHKCYLQTDWGSVWKACHNCHVYWLWEVCYAWE